LHNQLTALGVSVVTDRDADIHVSGHPARDELTRLYQWVRPRVAVPVHGEHRHMIEHAALARACQVPAAIVAPNGSVVRLAPGPAEVVDHVPTGRLARDGTRLVPVDDVGLRDRRKMLWNGAAVAVLVLDRTGRLKTRPRLTVQGLGGEPAEIEEATTAGIDALRAAVADLSDSEARDDAVVGEAARRAVRRVFKARFDKKPLTDVQVIRI
jgi:ribonuclease J